MVSIEVHEGDITRFEADALVNAANNHLWMGAGVAGALKRAGGMEIEEEAVKKGPVPVGEAVVTGAGRLKAKYVIHAVVMGQDLRTSAVKIQQATANSLRRADELGIKSIVFPALGTGVGGFSLEDCARVMLTAVRAYAQAGTGLEKVIFVLFGEPAYRVFKEELERMTGRMSNN
ncbi:MAG: macro domain-containing protein [Dehalococcoidia bacterium]|nr:macro domain-containing protein [Dehalococcoidia bacterium]